MDEGRDGEKSWAFPRVIYLDWKVHCCAFYGDSQTPSVAYFRISVCYHFTTWSKTIYILVCTYNQMSLFSKANLGHFYSTTECSSTLQLDDHLCFFLWWIKCVCMRGEYKVNFLMFCAIVFFSFKYTFPSCLLKY